MEHTAIVPLEHVGDNGLESVEAAVDVDLHDSVKVGGIHLMAFQICLSGDAGAVDENIQPTGFGGGLINSFAHSRRVGYVHAEGQRARAKLLLRLSEGVVVEVEQD